MINIEKNINYTFKSDELKELALSHSSFVNENRASPVDSNERLEFLGDAALELIVTEYLYDNYPELLEGELTKLRASVVCEPMLAKKARELSLGDALKMGKGEDQTGGRQRESTLCDLFEAVIGAIYLDGGYEQAKKFALRTLEPEIAYMSARFSRNDAKTYLQEQLQKNGAVRIEYNVISEKGPEHEKTFTVSVSYNDTVLGTGTGRSKKEAEQNAAANALETNRI